MDKEDKTNEKVKANMEKIPIDEIANQLNRLLLHQEQQKWALACKNGEAVNFPHQPIYLSPRDLLRAIAGDISLGIFLQQNAIGLAKAGVIDLDVPRDAKSLSEAYVLATKLKETAESLGLKAYIVFSGNRGYHVCIFAQEPVFGGLLVKVLKVIGSIAGFSPEEIFPYISRGTETKCIKLPTAINLKTGLRSGFVDDNHDPSAPEVDITKQAEIMKKIEQNSLNDLTRVSLMPIEEASGEKRNPTTSNPNSIEEGLKLLGAGNHPECIKHLATKGAPLDLDYNPSNLTLARYCVTAGLDNSVAYALAEAMAVNTSLEHRTSKTLQGKIDNFKSALKSAHSNPEDYRFDCTYVLANLPPGSKANDRGCIGTKCPLHKDYGKKVNSNPLNLPLGRFLFQTLCNLSFEGKSLSKGLILQGIEKLAEEKGADITPNKTPCKTQILEFETLAHFIRVPNDIAKAQDLPPEGFTCTTPFTPLEYLNSLEAYSILPPDILEANLQQLREVGVKLRALSCLTTSQTHLETKPVVEVLTTTTEKLEGLVKQVTNTSPRLSELVSDLFEELFDGSREAIPSTSKHLNNILNGGYRNGCLYVFAAPPGSGKTTFLCQEADCAAMCGKLVVIASFEMGTLQLFTASLSRLEAIDSRILEKISFATCDPLWHKRLIAAQEKYYDIAINQIILECDALYTPAKLKAICQKEGADMLVVDYLQLLSTGDDKLDSSTHETIRVSKVASDLKRVARSLDIPVLAISDINKNAYQKAMQGSDMDMGALRDSFKIAHASDAIFLLQSGKIPIKDKPLDQIDLLIKKYPEKSTALTSLRSNNPLDPKLNDTYARLTTVKNRGGKLGEPIFKYSRAIHTFVPLNLELETPEETNEI